MFAVCCKIYVVSCTCKQTPQIFFDHPKLVLCIKWNMSILNVTSWLKVAEHSFRARFCWCNRARTQGLQRAIFLFTQHPHDLCYFFSIIERSVLMALVFYYKDMLEKVMTQRNQQFSAFSLLPKEPS